MIKYYYKILGWYDIIIRTYDIAPTFFEVEAILVSQGGRIVALAPTQKSLCRYSPERRWRTSQAVGFDVPQIWAYQYSFWYDYNFTILKKGNKKYEL